MNISFENADKINGKLTLTVEETDYKDTVEKTLKDYRKRANVPGFRPGMVPMGLIKRQFGASAKMDAINKILGEKMYGYFEENNVKVLGEPLPAAEQEAVDLEKEPPYVFAFDIAVAPEFELELTNKDKVTYYDIAVDDKLIDEQVNAYAQRGGSYQKVEAYEPEHNDMLKGNLVELSADGNAKEGGISLEGVVMMPQYIKVEDQKKLFDGVKTGDVVTFNPKKAYPDNDTEVSSLLKIDRSAVADMNSDFTYQVTEITRFVKAEVNQQLFDQAFGEGVVKSEEEFRNKIKESLEPQMLVNSDWKFLQDVRSYAEKKVGEVKYPEELLKRVMLNNNKDKGADYVEKNFEASIKELHWHLIKEKLVAANNIEVKDDDVKNAAKDAARMQFAQYGMTDIPEEYVDNYANDMLKKRENVSGFVDKAVERKLIDALKGVVKLTKKAVTFEEFNKLIKE